MFDTVLVANRGEISVRAIRTLKRLGVKSVVVHSDPDRSTLPVRMADVAVSLPGEKPADTYLRIEEVIAAAKKTGAQAIYPGYGFLSESTDFAEACEAEGIRFVGPTSHQIREFGLKHRARELAAAAGVPMTPGTGLLSGIDEALEAAERIGYPIMLKSTAGGGGIGLSRCDSAQALRQAFESVQRLGAQYFRDAGVFLERCVERARHVEVQIFGDGKGRVIALGERDCSLQRRNQKVVEETPAPHLPAATRKALLEAAVRLGESVSYRSAGTVEFIYDAARDEFYFLEVNTRLQVEHPVTEMVVGVDLIEQMLRVSAGDEPDWEALCTPPKGAAMEVRIYAEDPSRQFQPSPGELTEVSFPDSVRLDGWIETGSVVSPYYDPMLAKLIVHGATREEALAKLRTALDSTRLSGISTNLEYLRAVVKDQAFANGEVWTRLLDSFEFSTTAIEVLDPGTQTSVQDHPGRLGYWNIGVPPSGPMDDEAFRIANRIVGNHASAAGLECTLVGPKLKFNADGVIALAGALCEAKLDGVEVGMWAPVPVKKGQILSTGRVSSGCRLYIAVRNGLDVPVYLGSRSTFSLGQFGGHAGRLLRAGDMLPVSDPTRPACTTPAPISAPREISPALIPTYGSHWEIGVVYGPHGAPDFLTLEAVDQFLSSDWKVHHNSNRLGVRLIGPKPTWTRTDGGEAGLHPSNVHDCEYAVGSINFTGDSPVILTCDGPSLGGFVCPFTIARAELWKVGQVKPGDTIRFQAISADEAVALEAAQVARIEALAAADVPSHTSPSLLPGATPSATIVARIGPNGHHPEIVYRQAGDTYLLLEYGENVLDMALRLRVYLVMEALSASPIPGIQELSPGVRSLQIRFEPTLVPQSELVRKLLAIEESLPDVDDLKIPTRVVHLPMAFQDSATLGAIQRYQETVRATAPWLPSNVEFMRRINGLDSVDQVRDILFQTSYMILGLGDVYLGAPCAVPLDPRHRLLTSKYNPARTYTAEGTVGIGGVYMCIYGMDSPGGYQLVGRTLPIWNKYLRNPVFHSGEPWLLKFFDQVRFYPVSEAELDQLRERFREGTASVRIEEEIFDYAAYRSFLSSNADDISRFQARQKTAFDAEVALWKAEESLVSAVSSILPDETVEESGTAVKAETSGSVWKLLVEPGNRVEKGQAILVIEAMKMELPVLAPEAGVLKAFRAKPGMVVSVQETLAWIDPL
ncbi:MAG: urea carboxylase [Fibrobacterota bacterium]|nr:urea carboxylase [Fibrobacterota bacterium]QQS03141.1 MAG: urea carboxylase [Fibrobacterota bacterium]